MADNDQVKPLAAAHHLRSDYEDHEAMSAQSDLRRKKLYIQCCGCLTVLLLIPVVVFIVLFTTVCHVKNPGMRMNSVSIQRQLEVVDGDQNITLLVDVQMKNPNYASFKFINATSVVYYDGVAVGEGRIPAGMAKARRTLRMNVTVDIVPAKVLMVQKLRSDNMNSETWSLSSYTRIIGKVKMLKIIKKNVVVVLNCSFTYNVSSQAIQDSCTQRVKL
ncbi:hypothetical protein Dsin_007787 [Dipteronia sinensis]|uniref:Late embryogenesis abundant protein LEA-2 subgroup domain-containing protein n=1 Tax=Dipteronia sinensis TaxID=43782 RepID=A0AAE0EGT2_9ROSI|nr:hypothetical protein Dsin_007780 [Dipteronia sinensis]KAK3227925.1 hypothetical protein Dsin_007787 [Dipteronia sinensis]